MNAMSGDQDPTIILHYCVMQNREECVECLLAWGADGLPENSYRFPVRINDVTRGYFEAIARLTPGEVGDAMGRLAKDPTDSDAAEVLWNQPEQVGITRTTCIATMLRAGHAENALPQSATATVNCRIFPGVEVADVGTVLLEAGRNPDVRLEVLDDPVASPSSPLREDVMDAVATGVERIRPGTPIIPYMAPYGTDGKEIRAGGIPTYGIMGVFMKDSDQFAHGLDERVPVRSFYDALEFWHVVIRRLPGGSRCSRAESLRYPQVGRPPNACECHHAPPRSTTVIVVEKGVVVSPSQSHRVWTSVAGSPPGGVTPGQRPARMGQ